jgi:signal peptide peptidase-like 3
MLLALVLFFDNRKFKDVNFPPAMSLQNGGIMCGMQYALTGYGIGLVATLAAGIFS